MNSHSAGGLAPPPGVGGAAARQTVWTALSASGRRQTATPRVHLGLCQPLFRWSYDGQHGSAGNAI